MLSKRRTRTCNGIEDWSKAGTEDWSKAGTDDWSKAGTEDLSKARSVERNSHVRNMHPSPNCPLLPNDADIYFRVYCWGCALENLGEHL